jgi:peptide/nickel transport system ATP-binding protein
VRDGRALVDLRDFSLRPGAFTFLFGESGIGKSLTARSLFGLLDPDGFDVTIDGEPYDSYIARGAAEALRSRGFFVFQEPSSHLNPLMTLEAQLTEGTLAGSPATDVALAGLWPATLAADLEDLLRIFPKPHRPSGGEKQRVLCAMAFRKLDRRAPGETDGLFVFDEPTGSLDNRYRDTVLKMLVNRFRRQRCTVLLITHDYSMISVVEREYADLLPDIEFKEFVLEGAAVRVQDFRPETYTEWLRRQTALRQNGRTRGPGGEAREEGDATAPPAVGAGRESAAVGAGQESAAAYAGRESDGAAARPPADPSTAPLAIESGARVFGRRLLISREPNGTPETPLVVDRGSMVYLKAPSGTGKTTVAKMALGLIEGTHFRARIGGVDVTESTPRRVWQREIWGRRMTMVFQHADEALNPSATVGGSLTGLPVRLDRGRQMEMLREFFGETVSEGFLARKVSALSGGQKQRLNLMRGLELGTEVVILDEPLNGLDFRSMQRVLDIVRQQMARGTAFLLISHNEEIFEAIVPPDRVYYLSAVRDGARSDA